MNVVRYETLLVPSVQIWRSLTSWWWEPGRRAACSRTASPSAGNTGFWSSRLAAIPRSNLWYLCNINVTIPLQNYAPLTYKEPMEREDKRHHLVSIGGGCLFPLGESCDYFLPYDIKKSFESLETNLNL